MSGNAASASRLPSTQAPGALPALEPFEIASGTIMGDRRGGGQLKGTPCVGTTPREVLEEILLSALRESPCLVSFSGGRDSSAILAVATHVARKHGLADPIPVTQRYPTHAHTGEEEWQEATVRHLGLRDWELINLTTELDALGPLGAGVLERHGPYWPPLAHAIVPASEAAAGGALVTGNGGDEVFSPWGWRRVSLVRRAKLHPTRSDLKWTALSLLPKPIPARLTHRRWVLQLPWLRPDAAHELDRRQAERSTEWTPTWADQLEKFLVSRYLELGVGAMTTFAREAGTRLVQPFLDPAFVRAMGAAAPREGFPSRRLALEAQVGDLLPSEVTGRSTKAFFTDVLWGPSSRAFAASWDGTGLDEGLIRTDELRRMWLSARPDFRSVTALQVVWLAGRTTAT